MLIIIAAVSRNNVIGKDDKIPWHIPEDLSRFKKITTGKNVLMGRKTFESILGYLGKPLPNRKSIIITRKKNYKVPKGVVVCQSLDEVIKKYKNQDLYVIGGAEVYKQTLPLADKLLITHVHKNVKGDTYFPKINPEKWKETDREDHEEFSFVTSTRAFTPLDLEGSNSKAGDKSSIHRKPHKDPTIPNRDLTGFTLIELLVTISIVAVLATAVTLVINPAEFLKKARDSKRLSDTSTIHKTLGLLQADNPTIYLGESNTIYVSLPDSDPQCSSYANLPSLPGGWQYACSTSANHKKVDGTGWIPVNFTGFPPGSPIATLPTDPINTDEDGRYYTYIPGSWKITSLFESNKHSVRMAKDNGPDPSVYEVGSNLHLANFARGLVGNWRFNEGSGNATDSSGHDNMGTITGNTTYVDGKLGKGASFDGVKDYFHVGDSSVLDLTTKITVALWAKFDSFDTNDILIHKSAAYGIWYDYSRSSLDNNEIQFMFYDTSKKWRVCDSDWTPSVGIWYHFAATYNKADQECKFYIDGKLKKTTTYKNAIRNGRHLRIGGWSSNTTRLKGTLDEVQIYNRALSARRIKAMYHATK